MPLREISHPAIDVDLRYARADNFTGKTIYDHAVAYLHRRRVASALVRAAELAAAQGLRLLVLGCLTGCLPRSGVCGRRCPTPALWLTRAPAPCTPAVWQWT